MNVILENKIATSLLVLPSVIHICFMFMFDYIPLICYICISPLLYNGLLPLIWGISLVVRCSSF